MAKPPLPDTDERRKAAREAVRHSEGRRRMSDSAGPSTFGTADMGTPDRVEWHLHNWAKWIKSGKGILGHAGRASGLSDGGTSQSFDDMAEASDRRSAQVVDAIIEYLPAAQREAIWVERRVMVRAYQAQRDESAALKEGKAAIGRELVRRGLW